MRNFAIVIMMLLIATGAGAVEKPASNLHLLKAGDSALSRDVYVLTFDFAAANIDYTAAGIDFLNEGVMPAGAEIVGLGWTDVVVEIYENEGASFSNWATEALLGFNYEDVDGVAYGYAAPFDGINEGPGSFGPATGYVDLAGAGYYPPATADFVFSAIAAWDDATGLPAGTWTSGIMYVEIESDVVATENATIGAVKALYR